MKRLIELANKIKNKELKKKTIELLENQKISNKSIKYPKANLEKVQPWIASHHAYEGGLIDHIVSVTEISIAMAQTFEKVYKEKINIDYVIAGALLHDIMKVFIVKEDGKELTGAKLDHAVFSAAELYSRGFPEEVVDIVASHGGEMGAHGANPRTIEAFIVFQADMADSAGESWYHYGIALPEGLCCCYPDV